MNTYTIKVITGSVREGRFAHKAAQWITHELNKNESVTAEVIDLLEYEMPFFNAPISPMMKSEPYTNENVERFTEKIGEADAFVMISPEYNASTSAVLKNAIDWVGKEWNNKPVAFVSYGAVGGARAISHLRHITNNLQMTPVSKAVTIPGAQFFPVLFGQADINELFVDIQKPADEMIQQLLWYTKVLKTARDTI